MLEPAAWHRPTLLLLLGLRVFALPLVAGCGETAHEPERSAASTSEREQVLGPFLAQHWQLPVPRQGEPPADYSPAEASLSPAACRACHPRQWSEWQTSLHAGAFSPGLAGQLIEGTLASPDQVRACQVCHAPLEEQQPAGPDLAASPVFDPALRSQGIVCASCHVRAHRRYGPPRRDGVAPPESPAPHGGFEARAEFEEARFCASCHQFFDDTGVAGKPIENTFREWEASPHGMAGRTCQGCHMPDRAHTWQGIHDPEFVRDAVGIALDLASGAPGRVRATLRLTSEQIGHRFPSYVTPRVRLEIWQIGEAGGPIAGTEREHVLGREIDFGTDPWSERFDTRLAPGDTARLAYDEPRAEGAQALVGRVRVDPAFHYRGVYRALLGTLRDEAARALIEEALSRADEVRYVLFERRLALGSPSSAVSRADRAERSPGGSGGPGG